MAGVKEKETEGFQDRVVAINRVAKVVKGGRRFSFSALVVVGDGKSRVGFGVGKAGEVPDAIRKASEQAKKSLIHVCQVDGTLPFEVVGRSGASIVNMFPAKSGKGVIAGGAVRTIAELGGIHNIVCKVHGSKNAHNVVRATMDGLKQLVNIREYSQNRGLDPVGLQQLRHQKQQKNKAGLSSSQSEEKINASENATGKAEGETQQGENS
ncbi:MAG: 30S ribosomal protein S5 [Deltaproteobacteria bacterium]|nr:30S ribosomal protein S5 [Deltaproteobacteria bacterium]